MGLKFDGSGVVSIPTFTATGDFTLSGVNLYSDISEYFIGVSGATDNFVGVIGNGVVRLRISGFDIDTQVFSVGTVITWRVTRVGSLVTFTVNGTDYTGNTTNTLTLDQIGGLSNNLIYSGIASGNIVLNRAGDARSYDTDNSAGTTLTDTTSAQNGTLTGFVNGGFLSTGTTVEVIAGAGRQGTHNIGISGGNTTPGRDFIDTNNTITKAGSLYRVDIGLVTASDVAAKVKVFRPNGANYDFVGQSQTFRAGLVVGNNQLMLDTPIAVIANDVVCIFLEDTNSSNHLQVIIGTGGTSWENSDTTNTVAQTHFSNDLGNNYELAYAAFAETSSAVSNALTITTPNNRFWQQSAGNAQVTIAAAYTGTPTAIERSVNGGAYTTAIAAPSGGVFTDTFTLATGQHSVSYRFSNETSANDTINNVVVGDVFACAGQSNMSGRGTNNQTFSNSAGGMSAYMLGNDDNFKALTDPYDSDVNQIDSVSEDSIAAGSWIVRFAHEYLAQNNVPIAFIPCAKGGSRISQWARSTSASTLYGSMRRRIDAVGGIKTVLWQQGESDAQDTFATTASEYQTALGQLANDIASDFSAGMFVVPLHTISAAGFNGNGTTTGQAAIRQAQIDAAANNSNIEIGQALTDIDLSSGDGLHFQTDAQLQTVAARMYQSYTTNAAPSTPSAGGGNSIGSTMGIINQPNFTPALDANKQVIVDAISAAVTNIILQVNENQDLIEGLSTVSGEIDSSSTAINTHTTDEADRILSELTSTDAAKLMGLINAGLSGVQNALVSKIDTLENDVTSTLIQDHNTTASEIDALIDAARDIITLAIDNKDYSELDAPVSSRATPADVVSARNTITAAIAGLEFSDLDAAVSSRASGSALTSAQAAIINAIDAIDLGNLNTTVSSRATPAQVTTAKDDIVAEIRRETSGSLYQRLISGITSLLSTVARKTDVSAVTTSVNNNVNSKTQNLDTTVSSRASSNDVTAACNDIKTALGTIKSRQVVVLSENSGTSTTKTVNQTISAVNLAKAHLNVLSTMTTEHTGTNNYVNLTHMTDLRFTSTTNLRMDVEFIVGGSTSFGYRATIEIIEYE